MLGSALQCSHFALNEWSAMAQLAVVFPVGSCSVFLSSDI